MQGGGAGGGRAPGGLLWVPLPLSPESRTSAGRGRGPGREGQRWWRDLLATVPTRVVWVERCEH